MASKAGVSDEIPIEEYMCLALYSASRAVTGLYRELLADLDLTYPQYLVMRVLWQRGPVPVKDIAAVVQLDYGTLSPLLKRLEAARLIRRERRADDERSVEITLTEAGESLRRKAVDVPAEFDRALGLDDRAQADLRQALARLTATIGARAG